MAWHGRRHRHSGGQYELHYFISGTGRFHNGDRVHPIVPGTLHLSPEGMTHQIEATDLRRPLTYHAVLFQPAGDEELSALMARLMAGSGEPWSIGTSHRFFFADLMERQRSKVEDLVHSAQHQFLSFLYALAAGSPLIGRGDNGHVEKALGILQASIERPLDLGTLCRRLGISREHLVRRFTDRMGMPPMRYLAHLRLEAAKAMLATTGMGVAEVSERLGFASPFNFTRAFKRATGFAPSAYRSVFSSSGRLEPEGSRGPKAAPPRSGGWA